MNKPKRSSLMYIVVSLCFLAGLWFVKNNVSHKTKAHIVHSGTVACFSPEEIEKSKEKAKQKKEGGKDKSLTCELSSATRLGNYIVTANDKSKDGLFFYSIDSLRKKEFTQNIEKAFFLKFDPEFYIKKIESTSVFKDWVIAFGSYDRNIDPLYMRIVAFKFDGKKKSGSDFHLVSGPELYDVFKKVIGSATPKGVDYFKIEASAIVPKEGKSDEFTLLLGVREDGKSYKDGENESSTKIIAATIFEKNGAVVIRDDWKLVYNRPHTKDFGISSLEYNEENKYLYALLAYEHGINVSGKLLRIKLEDLFKDKPLESVDEVSFNNHKPEGVAYLGNGEYFVVADEDRGETNLANGKKRTLNEAPYWIIKQDGK